MAHKLKGTEEEYPRMGCLDRPGIGTSSPATTSDFLTGGDSPEHILRMVAFVTSLETCHNANYDENYPPCFFVDSLISLTLTIRDMFYETRLIKALKKCHDFCFGERLILCLKSQRR